MTIPDPRDAALPTAGVHALLCSGVPLSLLMDLSEPLGPASADLYDAEPADLTWVPVRR